MPMHPLFLTIPADECIYKVPCYVFPPPTTPSPPEGTPVKMLTHSIPQNAK